MHARLLPVPALVFLASTLLHAQTPALLHAQTPASPQAPDQSPPSAPTIRTGTQLVIEDVVVQDAQGLPVHRLTRDSFRILDDKAPQSLRVFEEHSPATVQPGPALPPMPPGTFTDYTPVPPGGALNILLLDALNTPTTDQAYLREQLKQYVHKVEPGTRVAIFGLNTRLYILQGFTSDPALLRDVIDHKLLPRASSRLDDPVGTNAYVPSVSDTLATTGDPEAPSVVSAVQQFETQIANFQTETRIQDTLDAFQALAHYLSAFPGRKNLIWCSGSFPVNILPDPSVDSTLSTLYINDDQFRETTSLLARAEVAVYPVDVRGLMTAPMFNAANSNPALAAHTPTATAASLNTFSASQADEHATMEQLAADTGGRAFYNTNDLASAVDTAIHSGASYYTLAYTPSDFADKREPGKYHNIKVELTGAAAAQGLKLYYRHGYFADALPRAASSAAAATPSAPGALPPVDPAAAYARSAMLRGAPTPQDILFKVRVLPASTGTEATPAPDNQLDPTHPIAGPFRRFAVDYAALPADFRLAPQANGKHSGAIEFKVMVYDPDGKLLDVATRDVALNLSPDTYKRFMATSLAMHMNVSAPARGESFLRIAIHDLPSNRYGVVEIPTSAIIRLPPLPPPTPNPAASTRPQPASPLPF